MDRALLWWRDTWRGLRAWRWQAVFAITTVALALAAVTTVFSLVNGALLKPLPYGHAERLVTLDSRASTGFLISTSIPNYRDTAAAARSFDAYAGEAGWMLRVRRESGTEILAGRAVLGDLFGLLGVEAEHGRTFNPDEVPAAAGGATVVVLGHRYWQDQFGADPEVIGATLEIGGAPYTIIGVLPRGIGYPTPDVPVYLPMATLPDLPWNDRDSGFGTRAVARLAPGVTLETARADIARVAAGLKQAHGETAVLPELRSLSEFFLGAVETQLWLLMGAVGFVLLIAVANLGNLLLVRGEDRRRELALRAALGGRAPALLRLVLSEALAIALIGGVFGAALAALAVQAMLPLLPPELPAIVRDQLAVDWRVLLFGIGIAALAGLAFGTLPAARAARIDAIESIKSGSRGAGSDRGRVRSALVVAEIMLALVPLVGAGLMLKSLDRLDRVDKGFDAERLFTATVAPTRERVADLARWETYHAELESQAAALPGVESAAFSLLLPLTDRSWEVRLHPAGVPVDDATADSVLYNIVSSNYFDTLGLTLLRGRTFTDADRSGSAPVVVIDDTLAQRYWPGRDPIGQQITFEAEADGTPRYRSVIGVVRNLRHYEITEPSRVQVYLPMLQSGRPAGVTMSILLETSAAPSTALAPLRARLAEFDPGAALFRVQAMDKYVAGATARQRAMGFVIGGFAIAAFALAALGIFAVMSYTVAQQRREIGVRLALGASRRRILGWIGARTAKLTLLGIGLGVGAAALVTRMLEGMLYEVSPLDPGVFAFVALALASGTLIAGLAPAWRGLRFEPASVLTQE
jgi:predicted permease